MTLRRAQEYYFVTAGKPAGIWTGPRAVDHVRWDPNLERAYAERGGRRVPGLLWGWEQVTYFVRAGAWKVINTAPLGMQMEEV